MTRALAACVVLLLCACAAPGAPAPRPDLAVYAAASLREAFEALADAYAVRPSGTRMILALDASSALRAQIEQGAPADVFASADERNPDLLAQAGLAVGAPVVFAGNTLAIVTPVDSDVVDSPDDLAKPGIRVVGAGEAVPITAYARELLLLLTALPGYPDGFAAAVEANTVSREDNVRAVLAKIALGEGDAAIVYATDALGSNDVRAIPLPQGVKVTARYAAVAIAASPHTADATTFLTWLVGSEAQAILSGFGFVPAG